jgi:hypothetical protein
MILPPIAPTAASTAKSPAPAGGREEERAVTLIRIEVVDGNRDEHRETDAEAEHRQEPGTLRAALEDPLHA